MESKAKNNIFEIALLGQEAYQQPHSKIIRGVGKGSLSVKESENCKVRTQFLQIIAIILPLIQVGHQRKEERKKK